MRMSALRLTLFEAVLTLGRSSVKGLKRVSNGSASIWAVSTACATIAWYKAYHRLEGLVALLLARFGLFRALLPFGRHFMRRFALVKSEICVWCGLECSHAADGGGSCSEKLHHQKR